MLWHLLAPALAPLLGLFIVCIGSGFLSSLTTLRLDADGVSATMIGAVSSAYFIGLALGALFNDRLTVRIGHIRAYSSFASMIAVTALLQGLVSDPWAWFFFRLLGGWATVGVFLVVESWLLMAADSAMRGRLLAFYMIALYGSGVAGQAALGAIAGWGEAAPFMVAGMLASLSVLPMVILPRGGPVVERVEPLSPRNLLRLTPTGVVGCFGSGLAIAAVYTLLPLYLQRIGMEIGEVGAMMAWTILGAMVLQYPVGRWSDRHDRQRVLIALGLACTVLSAIILMLPAGSSWLAGMLFLLGGGIFAVYPVAVSHAADRAPAGALVRMIQGLLLINSLGSVVSPLMISPMMSELGPGGLFWAFVLINAGMVLLFLRRRQERPAPVPVAPFAAASQMTPTGVELRVTEDLVQGALDHEAAEDLSGLVPPPAGAAPSET
ncbi:MFS transporter [Bordetella trematum]|uniref:Membrane transport protein n=1 Tax=Bordetella trematum TaxID=123899 RepID=A0A157LTK2_9BORD|nr:MFS transporter [Bordetella trematum]AZR94656.1 MFS transporter [Bordetella trematum]NNH19407.1 MFS transporter [Bordetella trematum]SAI00182.1 membrane transport protein [Bordetella trematum]SAI39983.1 membrane transport protein [Bordetella trematum]SAI74021.1 membrane transport protein [Bordetella trematum]